jgi:prevent-host-death family protein
MFEKILLLRYYAIILTMSFDYRRFFERSVMAQREVITISEFKATCLSVLERVRRTGQSVLITRRGEPVALIDPPPLPQKNESWLGSFKSKGKITGNIVSPAVSESEWGVLNE